MTKPLDRAGYAWAAVATLGCTAAGLAMRPRFDLPNIAMVYLLAVVIVALRFSRGAAIATALMCVLAFDFLFVPPQGALVVEDAQYLLTFAIMIAVALVITGLKERLGREAQAQARLAAAAENERLRSTLLASISHDLRTPLAVMAGASSSLVERGERLPPSERDALARSIFEQAQELSDQVAKILDMTRLEAGELALDRDWASLEEIVASLLRRNEARLRGHRVIVELPPDLPLVRLDAALMEKALANLVENAARHTPEGTVIRVKARIEGAEVVVTVQDYAGGLAPADIERVFAKFHRGKVEGASGVGLGLAICRAIVLLHHGRTWAERVPEGGSAFHVALPLEPEPAVPREAAAT